MKNKQTKMWMLMFLGIAALAVAAPRMVGACVNDLGHFYGDDCDGFGGNTSDVVTVNGSSDYNVATPNCPYGEVSQYGQCVPAMPTWRNPITQSQGGAPAYQAPAAAVVLPVSTLNPYITNMLKMLKLENV